jgi:hypothetical protein
VRVAALERRGRRRMLALPAAVSLAARKASRNRRR